MLRVVFIYSMVAGGKLAYISEQSLVGQPVITVLLVGLGMPAIAAPLNKLANVVQQRPFYNI